MIMNLGSGDGMSPETEQKIDDIWNKTINKPDIVIDSITVDLSSTAQNSGCSYLFNTDGYTRLEIEKISAPNTCNMQVRGWKNGVETTLIQVRDNSSRTGISLDISEYDTIRLYTRIAGANNVVAFEKIKFYV